MKNSARMPTFTSDIDDGPLFFVKKEEITPSNDLLTSDVAVPKESKIESLNRDDCVKNIGNKEEDLKSPSSS